MSSTEHVTPDRDLGIEMELDAMRTIVRILLPMSENIRGRVLRWFMDIYEV